jgi:putative transposase
MRKAMVEKDHPQLSIRTQSALLGINRNRLEPKRKVEWQPKPADVVQLELMKLAHAKDPTMGARQLRRILKRNGYPTTRWKVIQMMRYLGLRAIYCKPRTTIPAPQDAKYPYLLGDIKIDSPDQVWAIDITYIPWKRGHVYLTAVIDWHTRAVLAWRVSNTMDVSFCLEALEEAVVVAGTVPEILNTDQGSQFTGKEWISAVDI